MIKLPKMMRAVVYRGVNDLRLEAVPVPAIQKDERLVQVAVCGVCPTDIKKIHSGALPPPRIFGHETAGTIVRTGARVALHHHIPCRDSHHCRHRAFAQCKTYKRTGITAGFAPAGGGYAEFVRVMPFVLPGVVKIPKRNLFEEGAMLEPVNTVLKAINRLNLLRGDAVLVAGQGPIGLMFTRLLALRGMNVTATDLLEARRWLARQFGATNTFNPTAKPRFSKMKRAVSPGFDAAIIAVPSDEAWAQAQAWVRDGGQTLLFAHTRRGQQSGLDLSTICVHEKDLLGSYSADMTLQKEVARLVFSRKMDVCSLITHRFTLAQTAEAIALASQPSPQVLKIIVCPG